MKFVMWFVSSISTVILLCLNVIASLLKRFTSRKARISPRDHVVVITGCDSGFGELAAIRLSKLGYKVVAACLTEAGTQRLKADVHCAVICDITKSKEIVNLVSETEKLCGEHNAKLWAVINNAGIAIGGPLDWIDLDIYRKVMEKKHSRVINLSSIAGHSCSANLSAYGASKHAMEGFMKSVRHELAAWNIHVSNINPGFMRTPMATQGTAGAIKVYNAAPEDIKCQYFDPKPMLEKGEELIKKTLEEPYLVIDSIVEAISDETPEMWYFPGYSSNVLRIFAMATSSTTDFFLAKILSGTVHAPKPEVLQKIQDR